MPLLLFIATMGAIFSIFQATPAFVFTTPAQSFMALANQLFTLSEYHQAYQYNHFILNIAPADYPRYMTLALVIISLITAGYLFVASLKNSGFLYALLLLFVAGVQIYFGVFALHIFNIIMFATTAWLLLKGGNLIVFATTITAIAIISAIFYLGEIPALTNLSEAIRDHLGETVERPIYEDALQDQLTTMPPPLDLAPEGDLPGGQGIYAQEEDIFAGSQIGAATGQRLWILWLIALGFVLWFLTAWGIKFYKAYTARKLFASAQAHIAVNAMFKHLTQWFAAFGVTTQHTNFGQYAGQLATLVSADYAQSYLNALNIWQKNNYSANTITQGEQGEIQAFLAHTKKTFLQTRHPIAKNFVRIQLFLQIGK